MNIAEALSREVARVATIRERMSHQTEGYGVGWMEQLIDEALENAHKAAGSGEAGKYIRAYDQLQKIHGEAS